MVGACLNCAHLISSHTDEENECVIKSCSCQAVRLPPRLQRALSREKKGWELHVSVRDAVARTPREGPEIPFDKTTIETLRKRADEWMAHDPYSTDMVSMNGLWFARMVTTLEKSLQ